MKLNIFFRLNSDLKVIRFPCKILVEFSDEISQISMQRNKREILENPTRIFREKLRRFINEIS